ncbi:uncharacterized protein LOC131943939 [Physella acuta]|uniref:uncharacterized protein LOC131943939 n=1 Tax=Physella acuta TaxID=109671 RepID=UPI0027DB0FA5|nr:uncharacterized protein LOC131943939 [Physella acuta]
MGNVKSTPTDKENKHADIGNKNTRAIASGGVSNKRTGDDSDTLNEQDSEEDVSQYFIGTHEVLECLEGQGEADLNTNLANCKKNPGHAGFIPINKLTLEHFPSGYHDNDLYELIKALADVTVRIAVKFTSLNRPEFVLGTKVPYPCFKGRGNNSLRTGTGRMWGVTKYIEGMDEIYGTYRTCPCPECDHSDTPCPVWWKVTVLTARHVVFDSSEAKQSSCRLWFDEDQSPVLNMYGWEVDETYTEEDWCKMYCVTHDAEIGEKLVGMLRRFISLWGKVSIKYESRKEVDKLTVIVSHPHGCSKQVSVGHWVHKQEMYNTNITRYTYTTCTCPGSSGAEVYRLGCSWSTHPHSGANSDGLNYSGVRWG